MGSRLPVGRVLRRRIFWAILGVVGVVLFLVGLTTAIVGRQASRERIVNQLETTTQLAGRDLADRPLARAALRADDEAAARIILNRADRSLQLDDGTSVTFGLLTTDFLAVADVVAALDFDTAALRDGRTLQLDQRIGLDQVVAVVRPVSIDDSPNLLLVIASRPLDRVRLREVFRDLAIPLFVAALIAALGARLVSGSVVKRLDGLRDATRLLGSGDWSARADVQGSDEVAELAATFNSLAEFLEQASARERAFLMSVSHDLRTPLTTVAGYAELLAQHEDSETSRIGAVLERETRRLKRLVEDVMLLAQLEARQFSVRPENVDLAAHVREVIAGFQPRAKEAHVELDVRIQPTGMVVTDPDRVGQIATNLLDNAIRHTPERGTVGIDVGRIGSEVTLRVTDSGPGVDPDEIDHLFERFYVGRQHERPEGSGLGLSIVRQLVAMLGGTARGELPPDGGLLVEVRLPDLPTEGST